MTAGFHALYVCPRCASRYFGAHTCPAPSLSFEAPIVLVSEANQREHWTAKHRRKRQQQEAMMWLLGVNRLGAGPYRICITRIAPRKLDSDNATGSAKYVRDAIAHWLGVNDGDERAATWVVEQEQKRKTYAVRVEIWRVGAPS